MTFLNIEATLTSRLKLNAVKRHRLLCVLRGDRGLLLSFVSSYLANSDLSDLKDIVYRSEGVRQNTHEKTKIQDDSQSFGCGVELPDHWVKLSTKNLKGTLGTQTLAVIYDGFSGISPDALGVLSGTIRAGGLMFVLLPESILSGVTKDYLMGYWPHLYTQKPKHNFLTRTLRVFAEHRHSLCFTIPDKYQLSLEGMSRFEEDEVKVRSIEVGRAVERGDVLTADQASALVHIEHVIIGHAKRPLVLTADRGRGKSFLLGVAAGHCQGNISRKVIITASSRVNVQEVFDAARMFCSAEDAAAPIGNSIEFPGGGGLRFIPVDQLIASPVECDVLFVDEAASIPLFLLERLLRLYNRIVFSSTIHGYEGHGRGFSISFKKILSRYSSQWKSVFLSQPVRFAEDDPLESVINQALLLDADFIAQGGTSIPDLRSQSGRIVCQRIAKESLIANDELLRAVFGLLVFAHYQTSPADLIVLLDTPNTELFVARQETTSGVVVGVCLVCYEGGFSPDLDRQVNLGKRRPRGHLAPQSFSFHAGCLGASELRCARVMRIATHPDYLRQGIASDLMHFVRAFAEAQSLDYLVTSFSAVPEVCNFWGDCDFTLLRVGVRKDGSSGSYALMMGTSFSPAAKSLFMALRAKLSWAMHFQMLTIYKDMLPEIALFVFLQTPSRPVDNYQRELLVAEVNGYCEGNRHLEVCIGALSEWLWSINRATLYSFSTTLSPLIIRILLQGWSTSDFNKITSDQGERARLSALKLAVKDLQAYLNTCV